MQGKRWARGLFFEKNQNQPHKLPRQRASSSHNNWGNIVDPKLELIGYQVGNYCYVWGNFIFNKP